MVKYSSGHSVLGIIMAAVAEDDKTILALIESFTVIHQYF